MNRILQMILEDVENHPKVAITEDLLNNEYIFVQEVLDRSKSLLSGMLEMEGHKPIMRLVFSENKLIKWCDNNNLQYYRDMHLKQVIFRKAPSAS